jgi:hypothetical protein
MSRKSLIIAIGIVVLGLPCAVMGYLNFLDLPPPPFVILPLDAYNAGRLHSKKVMLRSLADEYNQNRTVESSKETDLCDQRIHKIIGEDVSPEDLALLAIWAESSDPYLESHNIVYRNLFYGNLFSLAKMKGNSRAAYALWKIRESLARVHRWDGELAESMESAQSDQQTVVSDQSH